MKIKYQIYNEVSKRVNLSGKRQTIQKRIT